MPTATSLPSVLGIGPVAGVLIVLANISFIVAEGKLYKDVFPIFGSEVLVSRFRYDKLASVVFCSVLYCSRANQRHHRTHFAACETFRDKIDQSDVPSTTIQRYSFDKYAD